MTSATSGRNAVAAAGLLLFVRADFLLQRGRKGPPFGVVIVQAANRTSLRRHPAFHQQGKEERFLPLMMALVGVNPEKFHGFPQRTDRERLWLLQRGDRALQKLDDSFDVPMFGGHLLDRSCFHQRYGLWAMASRPLPQRVGVRGKARGARQALARVSGRRFAQ